MFDLSTLIGSSWHVPKSIFHVPVFIFVRIGFASRVSATVTIFGGTGLSNRGSWIAGLLRP
jgi:hypothetical protein